MRQVPFGPECGWREPQRWLCQIRRTCEDMTRRYGFEFVEDPGLPRMFGALIEIGGQLFVIEAASESGIALTSMTVIANGDIRSPRLAMDSALRAFECTADEVEAVNEDLSECPWMLTRLDDRGGREVEAFLRDADTATMVPWLRRRYPERDYRIEPAV